ncbi:MAG: DDE-type integrase/transposase/recombinase [Serratia symbiotica]|nr:DDE-type integrase/transposase/recombinase [Serratia symbiotica]
MSGQKASGRRTALPKTSGRDQIWGSDITYLKTGEGWLYLAAIMDLYSRRIVGWHVDKRMSSSRVCRALMKAYNLRNPLRGRLYIRTEALGTRGTASRIC